MFRRKTPKSNRRQEPVFPMLRTFALVTLVLAGAFFGLATLAEPAKDRANSQAADLDRPALAGVLPAFTAKASGADFAMGDVALGMSFQRFLALGPDGRSLKAAQGAVMGVLRTDEGVFSVYFPDSRPDARAFRVRFTRTLPATAEGKLARHLDALWGDPVARECVRLGVSDGHDCRYAWRPVGKVALAAQVRVEGDRALLRVDAFDGRSSRSRPGLRLADLGGSTFR